VACSTKYAEEHNVTCQSGWSVMAGLQCTERSRAEPSRAEPSRTEKNQQKYLPVFFSEFFRNRMLVPFCEVLLEQIL
jgi:hypothetical protein